MKLGFAAFDKGPNDMLGMVATSAQGKGHTTELSPAMAHWGHSDIDRLAACDVVATGFASFESHSEAILAATLAAKGVPHVLVEDVSGALVGRLKMRAPAVLGWAAGISIALPSDLPATQSLGIKHVRQITPPHWGTSYRALTAKGNPREKLQVSVDNGEPRPLQADDILILVFGTKEFKLEFQMAELAVAAGRRLFGRGRFVIGSHLHPKILQDHNAKSVLDLPGYGDLFKGEQRLVTEGIALTDALRAADVAIFSGAPMESITGAFANLPLLSYEGGFPGGKVLPRNLTQGVGVPTGKWFVSERGGAIPCDESDFTDKLSALLDSQGRAELTRAQMNSFPVPGNWDTASELVDFLVTVAGDKKKS